MSIPRSRATLSSSFMRRHFAYALRGIGTMMFVPHVADDDRRARWIPLHLFLDNRRRSCIGGWSGASAGVQCNRFAGQSHQVGGKEQVRKDQRGAEEMFHGVVIFERGAAEINGKLQEVSWVVLDAGAVAFMWCPRQDGAKQCRAYSNGPPLGGFIKGQIPRGGAKKGVASLSPPQG